LGGSTYTQFAPRSGGRPKGVSPLREERRIAFREAHRSRRAVFLVVGAKRATAKKRGWSGVAAWCDLPDGTKKQRTRLECAAFLWRLAQNKLEIKA
jgi:hypothetical protein